jgi:hypothetical protein
MGNSWKVFGPSPTYPIRASSPPIVCPEASLAVDACAACTVDCPAYTSEEPSKGKKRAPSSFVQLMTASGALVLMPCSFKLLATSKAPITCITVSEIYHIAKRGYTPSGPSNFPPVATVSMCDPMAIGGILLSSPGINPNCVPVAFTYSRVKLRPYRGPQSCLPCTRHQVQASAP